MTSQDAAELLAGAEASGDLAAREAGIRLGLEVVAEGGADARLLLALSRALRAHYRTTYELRYLDAAASLPAPARVGPAWLAERARVLAKLGEQLQLRAETAVAEAGSLADAAVAAAAPGSREAADASWALGVARLAQDRADEALALLESAVAGLPGAAEPRIDLAIALASTGDEGRASEILTEVAQQDDAARDAFEAARFHGFWAAGRGAWDEAGDGYARAVHARAKLRQGQVRHEYRRQWLVEAGPIPAQAACALVRADRPADAISALDAGLALNLSERLGTPAPEAAGGEVMNRVSEQEPVVFLAFDDHGGAAIIAHGPQLTSTTLAAISRPALVERLLVPLGSYATWLGSRSPRALKQWMTDLQAALAWIGTVVVEPLLPLLPDGDSMTVISDGLIGLLPLGAVPVGDSHLLDLRAVRLAPAARLLHDARAQADAVTDEGVCAVGLRQAGGLPVLEHAELEAAAVAAVRDGEVLLGAAATTAAVEASLDRFGTVHLACHADALAENPLGSPLVLADGTLTLGRLLDVERTALRLVVLSACETGVPDVAIAGEMLSLAGAFLHAGAAGIAATHWAVGDKAAALLSLYMHSQLARQVDPCRALRSAQVWLRDSSSDELSEWIRELGPALAPELSSELAALVEGLPPHVRPFELPLHWAGFAYFGA